MNRINNVLKNVNQPEEYLVARVDPSNILSVMSLEKTAIVTSPTNVIEKNIMIVCGKKVVAVGTIKKASDYDPNIYARLWEKEDGSWRSLIEFENVILIGDSLENIFGKDNKVKYVHSVMNLRNDAELKAIVKAINTFYLFNLNLHLSNIGLQ